MKKKSLKSFIEDPERSTWHGGGRRINQNSYEGSHYRGGRKKKTPNLIKLDNGGVVNKHGVAFTQAEKKALESAVNTANRKRMKMLKEEANLPRLVGGKPTGQKIGSLHSMGTESDFILARKTKSLHRFSTKKEYDIYMNNLKRVNSPTYIDDRTRLYKRSHMTALENVFGDEAKDVIMKIRMMKPDEYRKHVASDEMLDVAYIYDPSSREGKLNRIRAALGMKLKEEYIGDFDE